MLSALELALCPGWFLPDLRRAAVNPVADAPSLAIPSDAILPFVRTRIPAVSIDAFFVTGQQLGGHNDIMGIGPSHLNGVDQTGILVHSNVRLVAEVPCVSLLHLMRVRVPLLSLIFCGGWRCNDRGVHNGPFFEDKSSLLQKLHYLAEQLLLQPIAYQQIPKTPQCISVRHLVAGVHSAELRKGSAVYDLSHCCFVRQIIQVLQQIDPQHPLQIVGLIAAFPLSSTA